MSQTAKIFNKKATEKASDLKHRQTINFNMGKYNKAVKKGKQQYLDLELAKKIAKNKKWRAIENLATNLELFESNFKEKGGKVIWAETAEQAIDEILVILKKHDAKTIVKSKSMATEELHFNEKIGKKGYEVLETDLGEYIVQLADEKPYHIVTPAMHKSKEDIQQLFNEKLGTDPTLNPTQLTNVARENLRQKYVDAEVGITGANFLVADTGSICITENEGNGRLSTAFPKVHIAIAGIDKMIQSIDDLQVLFPILATYGTGQNLTVYNSIISGPKKQNEESGPEEMYVILLDNGRTDLLAKDEKYRESFHCIRCGACLNACPIYKNIGGHTYDTTYSGPIGAVISPQLNGIEEFGHLSFASSLCGQCTETCPMGIDLHNLLLENRNEFVQQTNNFGDNLMWSAWKKAMLNRKLMNAGGAGIKNLVLSLFFKNKWGKSKELPKIEKSFNQYWKEKNGK